MKPLHELKFLFITGKGGSGKTTVTVALARALARRGRRVLVTMTETKERASTLFGVPPIGDDIVSVAPDIWAVRIDAEKALGEYGEMVLHSRALYNTVFGNRYVQGFFAAVPGLHQWAVLGKAWYHSTEQREDGSPRYDVVLFDAPATGHGLEMLRVPKVIVEVAPPGLLRRDAERAWAMFQDPDQTGVVIVALPEDMPVTESIELADAVRNELRLPLTTVVVNAVMEALFSEDERHQLLAERTLDPTDPGDVAIGAAVRRAIGERVQEQSLRKLEAAIDVGKIFLPKLLSDATNPADVALLAERLAASFEA